MYPTSISVHDASGIQCWLSRSVASQELLLLQISGWQQVPESPDFLAETVQICLYSTANNLAELKTTPRQWVGSSERLCIDLESYLMF